MRPSRVQPLRSSGAAREPCALIWSAAAARSAVLCGSRGLGRGARPLDCGGRADREIDRHRCRRKQRRRSPTAAPNAPRRLGCARAGCRVGAGLSRSARGQHAPGDFGAGSFGLFGGEPALRPARSSMSASWRRNTPTAAALILGRRPRRISGRSSTASAATMSRLGERARTRSSRGRRAKRGAGVFLGRQRRRPGLGMAAPRAHAAETPPAPSTRIGGPSHSSQVAGSNGGSSSTKTP